MKIKRVGPDGKEYWEDLGMGKACYPGYGGGIKATRACELVPTTKGIPESTKKGRGRPRKGSDGRKTPWAMPIPRRYNFLTI
jgi:hypothetical protein